MKKLKTVLIISVIGAYIFGVGYMMNRPIEIHEPNFLEAAGGNCYSINLKNEISDVKVAEVEKSDIGNTVYVFRSKIDKSLVDKVCKEYNVENKSESFGNCTIYGVDNGSRMKIYNDGSFEMYTDSFSLDEMTISTNDCIVKARDVLKDVGMSEDDFKYKGVIVGTCGNAGEPKERCTISREVVFTRILNNTDVYGKSKCSVNLERDGEVQRVCVNYTDNYEKVDVEKRISVEEAIEAIKKNKGQIQIPDEADEVVITDVDIKYWEESDDSARIIQPVYEFNGKAYRDGKEIGRFNALETLVKN